MTKRLSAFLEDRLSMLREKGSIRRNCVLRKREFFAGKRDEVHADGIFLEEHFQAGRDEQPQIIIEADQAAIEGRIVETGETKAIAHIQTLGGMSAPWKDVRGDEQIANGKSSDATATAEIVQHGGAEVFLTAALLHHGGGFRFANGR